MVVVEGVARKLGPQLNMLSTADLVVGDRIADDLEPAGGLDDLSRGLSSPTAFLVDAPRRLEDVVGRLDLAAKSGLDDRLHNLPAQSRIANTTIVVIAISLTAVAILCYRWWH